MSADCFLRPAPQRDDLGIVLEEVEKLLDINDDGIINGRDLAYLKTESE